jgi:hypothetical protein
MPTESYKSEQAILSELEAALGSENRYLDLCLVFRHKATGQELLRVGGRWDRTAREFIDPDPEDLTAKIVTVNANQVATVLEFKRWLHARLFGGPRKRMLLTGGDRRGGKSFIVTALCCAAAVAIPDALCWYVSPTLKRRDELERYTKRHTPQAWRKYLGREMTFVFANGARIINITGDDAEDLKRGEADLIVYNEPQTMTEDVVLYGAPALIDHGGLMLFAGNPARKRKGVWFTRLVRAIEAGTYTKGVFCRLSARDNPDIDADARSDISEFMHLVNPQAARADDEGVFLEPGNFAYAEHWDDKRNTVPSLDVVEFITADVVRRAGGGPGRDTLCGVDFQQWPYNAGVSLQAFGDPKDPTWFVTGCLLKADDEDLFLDEAYGIWRQDRTLWIGDASGSWQDAAHTRGRCSFDKFRARRWRIEAPQKKKTDRGEHPANPPIADRLNLVNTLLRRGKLVVVMDAAAPVAEALQKCEVDPKGKPRGKYAHLTDALGYPLWWATPDERARAVNAPSAATFPKMRPGAGFNL